MPARTEGRTCLHSLQQPSRGAISSVNTPCSSPVRRCSQVSPEIRLRKEEGALLEAERDCSSHGLLLPSPATVYPWVPAKKTDRRVGVRLPPVHSLPICQVGGEAADQGDGQGELFMIQVPRREWTDLAFLDPGRVCCTVLPQPSLSTRAGLRIELCDLLRLGISKF